MSGGAIVQPKRIKAVLHVFLISIPLIVIVGTILVALPGEQIAAKIFTKPEWYFISLVLVTEALRDSGRSKEIAAHLQSSEAQYHEFSIVVLVVFGCLAGLAAYSSLGVGGEDLAALRSTISYLAVLAFSFSCWWCYSSRMTLLRLEMITEAAFQLRTRGSGERLFDAFSDSGARMFYDLVCNAYNARNASNSGIRKAQDELVKHIIAAANSKREGELTVLDVGGGTGDNIRNKLMAVSNLKWTSVDISPKMSDIFLKNFGSDEALTLDFTDPVAAGAKLSNRRFDVIVFSFSMSSMRRDIDFNLLRKMLAPEGQVLIADIHPGYIAFSPKFDISVNQQLYALLLRRVEPMALELNASSCNLIRCDWAVFKKDQHQSLYSFVLCFRELGKGT